jgi:hypothetical protein
MGRSQGGGVVVLLLFRVAGHGYASPRDQVLQVVDVGTGLDPVPGLGPSSLLGLGDGDRVVGMASLRRVLGLPERDAYGRLLVVATGAGLAEVPATEVKAVSSRLGSGYVSGTVSLEGGPWSVVDWDALRAAAER